MWLTLYFSIIVSFIYLTNFVSFAKIAAWCVDTFHSIFTWIWTGLEAFINIKTWTIRLNNKTGMTFTLKFALRWLNKKIYEKTIPIDIVVQWLHSQSCQIKPFLLLCSDFIQICSQFFCSDGEQFENDSALDSDSEHVPHVFGHIFSILVLPMKSTFDESKQNSLNLSHWLLGFS